MPVVAFDRVKHIEIMKDWEEIGIDRKYISHKEPLLGANGSNVN